MSGPARDRHRRRHVGRARRRDGSRRRDRRAGERAHVAIWRDHRDPRSGGRRGRGARRLLGRSTRRIRASRRRHVGHDAAGRRRRRAAGHAADVQRCGRRRAILDAIAANAPADERRARADLRPRQADTFRQLRRLRVVIHQADWIAGHFSGRFDVSDENNALKTGYDPVARRWPDGSQQAGVRSSCCRRAGAGRAGRRDIAGDSAKRSGCLRDV